MRAVVTGGTGFVGSHLVEVLRDAGHEVTLFLRSPEKAARLGFGDLPQVRGDLEDAEALERTSRGSDVVFHVAGLVAARNEAEFLRVNRDGAERVARAAVRGGAGRLVLVSSMAAAGPALPGCPLTGGEPPNPVTAYGRSKLAGENVVAGSGIAYTIVRPPLVYGPRDTEVLKAFRAVRSGWAPVFGTGDQELSAVHARDLAHALLAAAESEGAAGGTYYACHPQRFTSAAFAEALAAALGRRVRLVRLPRWLALGVLSVTEAAARLAGRATILNRDKANEFFQPAWTGDPRALEGDTGWRAEFDLASGLPATVAWYRERGWL